MRLLINGLPYFASQLAQHLGEVAPHHTFRFYDTYNSRIQKSLFALHLYRANGMISINGVSDKSGSLDLAMRYGKKIWMQWQGTDVMLALKRHREGNIYRKYIDYATHATDAPWLKEELKSIGIDAQIARFKWLDVEGNTSAFSKVQVYSYLAEGKELFYGWELYKKMALTFPEIKFVVAGSTGQLLKDVPSNVDFWGWIDKVTMQKLQSESAIFIRFTEHDGYSLSVFEALAHGSEVIWNKEVPNVHNISTIAEGIKMLESVIIALQNRNLSRNLDSIDYISNHFNRHMVNRQFVDQLELAFER
jgi:hypothetical protein